MNNQPNKIKFLYIYVALILGIAIFLFGYYWGAYYTKQEKNLSIVDEVIDWLGANINNNVNVSLFSDVWEAINDRYVNGQIDQTAALYGIISGLVSSLADPNSIFLDPESAKIFNEEITGNFEGIGVEIAIKNDKLVVVAALSDTPADRAGLLPGDEIIKIDNQDTAMMTLDYAVAKIRGEKDTEVTLSILREGEAATDYKITRQAIKIKSVDWQIKTTQSNKKIGYITISQFSDDTVSLFQEATNFLLLQSPDGLILDLRGNPGGYLDVSIDIASEFIDNNVVLIEKNAAGVEKKIYDNNGEPKLNNYRTVILIDEGSASASEILAGALHDYNLAKLVGQKTFGKGSVQDLEDFPDGSLLKLTVAKWLTPLGLSIDEQGIEPDYSVELTKDDYNNDRDPQLDKALELFDDNAL